MKLFALVFIFSALAFGSDDFSDETTKVVCSQITLAKSAYHFHVDFNAAPAVPHHVGNLRFNVSPKPVATLMCGGTKPSALSCADSKNETRFLIYEMGKNKTAVGLLTKKTEQGATVTMAFLCD